MYQTEDGTMSANEVPALDRRRLKVVEGAAAKHSGGLQAKGAAVLAYCGFLETRRSYIKSDPFL
jgi:hypothetical protein